MEECRNTVIKSHAIYSMIISKFTGNISKRTSKSTSKTNRIRLGGPWGPGPRFRQTPKLARAARRLHWPCPRVREPRAKVQSPQGAHGPLGGNTLSRGSGGRYFPPIPIGMSSQMAPPDARGPLEVLVGIVLGELDSSTPRVSGTIEI